MSVDLYARRLPGETAISPTTSRVIIDTRTPQPLNVAMLTWLVLRRVFPVERDELKHGLQHRARTLEFAPFR